MTVITANKAAGGSFMRADGRMDGVFRSFKGASKMEVPFRLRGG